MNCNRVNVFRFLSIVLGCAVNFNEGSLESFNVYSKTIKGQFNYTQKEVEFLSSMSFGFGLAFLPGMFYDRYGPRPTSFVGLLLVVSSFILIWSTSRMVGFYRNHFWLMALYFFTCGFGYEFTNIATLTATLVNFDNKYAGKITGIQYTCFWVGTSVYSWAFYTYFGKNGNSGTVDDNPTDLLLLFAVCIGVVDVACVFVLRRVNAHDGEFEELKEEDGDELTEIQRSVDGTATYNTNTYMDNSGSPAQTVQNNSNSGNSSHDDNEMFSWFEQTNQMSLKELLLCLNYQLVIWMIAFAKCVSSIYEFNITVLTRALRYDYIEERLTVVIPITRATVTILTGVVSDYFIEKVSRLTIFIIGLVVTLLSQIGLLLFADTLWVLVLASISVSMSLSMWAAMPPAIMREQFHPSQFGRNWGLCIMLGQLLGLASQTLFGALYDNQISDPNETDCFGMHCLRGGIGLAIALNGLSIAIGVCIYIRLYYIHR